MIRVLVVDDHLLLRHTMIALLGDEPTIEVVGEAGDGLEAVNKTLQLKPDVVLMDIKLPEFDGIEATRRIRSENGSSRILMVSQYTESPYIESSKKAGANGFLCKGDVCGKLVEAIRVVHEGGEYY